MWFDDANVQIIGFSVDNFDDMSIEERLEYFGIRNYEDKRKLKIS